MGYDDVLLHLGEFGRYQKRIYFLLCLPTISCAFHKLASVFLQAKVNHRCLLPYEFANATYPLPPERINMTLPWDSATKSWSSCSRLDTNFTEEYFNAGVPANRTVPCQNWVYDPTKYVSSAVTEFDLVCNDAWLRATADALFMVGVLLGSIGFGDLSDRFVPESARWLLSQGRAEEAKQLIIKAAKENKVTVPKEVLEGLLAPGDKEEIKSTESTKEVKPSLLDLMRHPNLRKKALNIFFNWFVNSGTYYGLSWNTSNLGGNDYLNFFISGAVEIPAYSFLLLTLNRWGRKSILCGCMLVGGVSLLLTLAVPYDMPWLLITFAMIGKLAITASYGTVYVFSAEQFPTVIRNVALGASSTCARVGGILAPYVNLLADYWQPLPLLIFGLLALTAGLFSLLLPETLDKKLPDTIEEGENFGKVNNEVNEANDVNGEGEGNLTKF